MDNPDFIYFSPLPWRGLYQRPQHTARLLSEHGQVLFVEPRTLHLLAPPTDADPLHWLSLPVIPTNARNPALRTLARVGAALAPCRRLVRSRQERLLLVKLASMGMADPLLLFGHPDFYPLRRLFPRSSLAYDHMDDVLGFGSPSRELRRDLIALAREADLINATSKGLAAQMRSLGSQRVLRCGNGVEWERFARAGSGTPAEPAELTPLARPRAIYAGSVAEWFDLDLLFAAARELPGWSFPVLGPLRPGLSRSIQAAPVNVHFLGPQPYEELPAWMAHCQAALIPFRVTPLTAAVDPVKLYEYLASGLPVVTTPFSPEVQGLEPAVRAADSGSSFAAALAGLVAAPPDPAELRALAEPRRWERQLAPFLEALVDLARSTP